MKPSLAERAMLARAAEQANAAPVAERPKCLGCGVVLPTMKGRGGGRRRKACARSRCQAVLRAIARHKVRRGPCPCAWCTVRVGLPNVVAE